MNQTALLIFQEKDHTQEKVSEDREEDFQPDDEPYDEEAEFRYLPKMAVRIKAIKNIPLGKTCRTQ